MAINCARTIRLLSGISSDSPNGVNSAAASCTERYRSNRGAQRAFPKGSFSAQHLLRPLVHHRYFAVHILYDDAFVKAAQDLCQAIQFIGALLDVRCPAVPIVAAGSRSRRCDAARSAAVAVIPAPAFRAGLSHDTDAETAIRSPCQNGEHRLNSHLLRHLTRAAILPSRSHSRLRIQAA